MNKSQQRHIDRLRRVAGFGARHENDFRPGSRGPALFGEIVDLLNEIEAAARPRKREIAESKRAALSELRLDMVRIAETARVIETHNENFAGKFLLPDQRRSTEDLVWAAKQFMTEAEESKQEFLDYELPADFLEQMQGHLDDFLGMRPTEPGAADAGKERSLKELIGDGQQKVELLKVLITNKYRDDKSALVEWNKATKA